MPTPDLPVELWLEILSYLPRTYLPKMVGVNRTCFELALDYKYEEIRFISDDEPMMRLFQQLKYPNIAKRVRQLYLRPAFLPGIDEVVEQPSLTGSLRLLRSILSCVKKTIIFKRPSQILPPGGLLLHADDASSSEILQAAKEALARCPNLRELTVVVYDHVITDSFREFLETLFRTTKTGSGLEKLCIQTTLAKIPTLLGSVAAHASKLQNLHSLDLSLMNSRFPVTDKDTQVATKTIVNAVTAFKHCLTHLSLSSAAEYDHTLLFETLGTVPKLRTLELWFIISLSTLSKPESLANFLLANSQTLEHLVLKPKPRVETFHAGEDTLRQWVMDYLPRTTLPNLKTLDLGLRNHYDYHEGVYPRLILPKLIPIITPQLATLILTLTPLSHKDLAHVLDMTSGALEGLECRLDVFSPSSLDLLAKRSPRLTSLRVCYDTLHIREHDNTQDDHVTFIRTTTPSETETMVRVRAHDRIQCRRYPRWPLRHLRIGRRGTSCGETHPDAYLAKCIAETVLQEVEQDTEYRCLCYYPSR